MALGMRGCKAEGLAREQPHEGQTQDFAAKLQILAETCAALPDLDDQSADAIIGYDKTGLWS